MNVYLSRLTFFRFIAAVLVVYFHVGQKIPPMDTGLLHTFAQNGTLAVSFFYCLSGFVLTTVYDRDDASTVAFWIARFARIYPVYLLCLLFCIAIPMPFPPLALALDVFLLQSWAPGYPSFLNGPAWSLSVEALFYALFPFLLRWLRRSSGLTIGLFTAAIWIITQFAAWYLFTYRFDGFATPSADLIFYFPLLHLNVFVMGCAGALFFKKLHRSDRALMLSIASVVVSVAVVAIVKACAQSIGLRVFAQDGLYAPIFVSGMWFVGTLPKFIGDILSSRPLVMLGESSYTLYLLQVPLVLWLQGHLPGIYSTRPVLYFYIYLVALIAASLAIFLFFESPARKHLRIILGRMAGTPQTPKLAAGRD